MKANQRKLLLLGGGSLALVAGLCFWPQSSYHPSKVAGKAAVSAPLVAPAAENLPTDPALAEPAAEALISMAKDSPNAAVAISEPIVQPDLAKLAAFDGWIETWQAASPGDRARMTEEGVALAAARRPEFKALIVSDPRLALERSVPRVIRQDLPEEIVAQLEKPVSAKGEFNVYFGQPIPGIVYRANELSLRYFETAENSYTAHVFGALERLTSRKIAPLQGVAVDREMAIAENAVRRLEIGERVLAGTVVEESCPVSGETTLAVSAGDPVTVETPLVEIAGRTISLCEDPHAAVLEQQFRIWVQAAGSGGSGFFTDNFPGTDVVSIGNLRFLYIRARYSDQVTAPNTEWQAHFDMKNSARFLLENSYGKLTATTTVTPLITLPQPQAWYSDTVEDRLNKVLDDARVEARRLGYDSNQYNTTILRVQGGLKGDTSWGTVGRIWLSKDGMDTINHEAGHTLGLDHANFWLTTDGTAYGNGESQSYGNLFDIMGSSSGFSAHYNTVSKLQSKWLTSDDIHEPKTNGVYRLHAYDQPQLEEGKRYALRVSKDSSRQIYLEYHPARGGLLADSALVIYKSEGINSSGELVDTTPDTLYIPNLNPANNTPKLDAGIALGRTFSDLEADMHFTVIAKNATSPPSLDIFYQRGPFPGNTAPDLALNTTAINIAVNGSVTFNAVADDDEGDALAYYWEFDDGVSAPNSSEITRTFTTAAQITAMVTVSDMKGGIARRHVVINVGAHGRRTITGNITLAGQPLANVRVAITGEKFAYTDASGNYALAGVNTGNRTLTALLNGYTFAPAVSVTPLNVVAGGNIVNWVATASGPVVTLTKTADATESAPAEGSAAERAAAERAARGNFTLTRTGDIAASLVVRVSPPGGSAAKPADYNFAPDHLNDGNYRTFTIPEGRASLDIVVTAVNDVLPEGPETITLQLASNGNYRINSASAVVMTVTDNDTQRQQVSVVSNDPYAAEFPGDGGTFTFTRTVVNPDDLDLNLDLTLAWSGTATGGADVVALPGNALPGNVRIPANETSYTLNIAPVNDATVEGPETVIATIGANAAAYVIDASRNNATVRISDDDVPVVTVSVPDAAASEAGMDSGLFLLHRTGDTGAALKVYYGVHGTALHGNDYASLSGEVVIPAGAATAPVMILPHDDDLAESLETVILTATTFNSAYSLGPVVAGTVSISENGDLPAVGVRAGEVGVEGGVPAKVIFSCVGNRLGNVLVNYTVSGTATSGTDFPAMAGSVQISTNGTNEVSVDIPVSIDNSVEGTETVVVTLTASPDNYQIYYGNSAEALIRDGDSVIGEWVGVSALNQLPSEAGVRGTYYFSRLGTAGNLAVNYAVAGTATNGTDFGNLNGIVNIPAGQRGVELVMVPFDDAMDEANETVTLTVTPGQGYSVDRPSAATLTILDRGPQPLNGEPLPLVSVRTGRTGSENGQAAMMIFRAIGNRPGNVVVNYSVTGTATSVTDFTAMEGTVLIPTNGENEVNVDIPVINDLLPEPTETVIVTLTASPATYRIDRVSDRVYIRDDDAIDRGDRVGISALHHKPSEAGVNGSYYFFRADTAGDLVVNYAVGGTAINGADFVNLPGTVTIPDGQRGVDLVMVPLDDQVAEGDETVTLTVTPGLNYSVDRVSEATFEILDSSAPALTVGFVDRIASTSELPHPDTGEFRDIQLRLSEASPTAVTVQVIAGAYTSSQGDGVDWSFVDAANGNAFLPTATVTFPANVVVQSIRLRVKNDLIAETPETIVLELSSPRGARLSPSHATHQIGIYDGAVPANSVFVTEELWYDQNVYTNQSWNGSAPNYIGYLNGFTARSNIRDGFSRRMIGQIVAPATGDYTFWIASDNSSRLYLSNTALAVDKVLRASLNGVVAPLEWERNASQRSVAIPLVAGQSYYMEVQHQENITSDHVAVAWEGPGFARQAILVSTPDESPRTVRLAMAASTRTEADGSEPLLMVLLNRPAGALGVTVDFTVGGTATSGIDYVLPPDRLVFAPGEQVRHLPLSILADAAAEAPEAIVVSISNPVRAELASPTTHVITVQDAGVPTVETLYATASSDSQIDTLIDTAAATPAAGRNITGWAIVAGNTGNAFAINAAGRITLATPASLPNRGGMQLIVRATDDLGLTGDGLVNVVCTPPANGVTEQRWGGNTEFKTEFGFAGAASFSGTLATFTTPANVGDSYSRRLLGYLKPTVSDDYTFWIAGNDGCRLFLSNDGSPSGKKQIASVGDWSNFQQWDKTTAQKSAVIPLVAGRIYWMEAQHLEGSGGDHVSVAWQRDGVVREAIPAAVIFPYIAGVDFDNPPQLPSIALTSPAIAAAYDTGDSIPLTANIAGGTQAITAVEFYRGNVLIGSDASAPYDVTWLNAIAGNHELTARAVYAGGSVTSSATNVVVSDLDPAGDRDGDGFTNGLEFTLGTDPRNATLYPTGIYASLRAWWKFDEISGTVADDSTGRAQDGIVTGAAWEDGIAGMALSFTGATQGVLMGAAPSIVGSGDFTVSAWVKVEPGSTGGTVIQQRESGAFGYRGQYALNVNADGTVNFYVYGDWSYQFNLNTADRIDDGRWHLIAATRQGVNGRILIDGISAANGSDNANLMPLAAHAVSVGYDMRDLLLRRFNGLIDEVKIYERVLTAAELRTTRDSLVPNGAPAFTPGSLAANATEDLPFVGQLTATDPDYGDTQIYEKVDIAGWLQVAENGALSGTPSNSDVGTKNYTVRVTDSDGRSSDGILVITVANVNDAPVAVNDGSVVMPFVTLGENSESSPITVLANDSDVDLNPLTVTEANSLNGAVVINSGTTLTFTPAANFNGAATINYTISDGQGGAASATVYVSVNSERLWDIGVADGLQGGAGTWSTLANNTVWADNSEGSGRTYWRNTASAATFESARLRSGTGRVTVSEQINLRKLTVDTPTVSTLGGRPGMTYIIGGAGSLAFGSQTGEIVLGSTTVNASMQIGANITGSGGLTIESSTNAPETGGRGWIYMVGDNTGLTGGITLRNGLISVAAQNHLGSSTQKITLQGDSGLFGLASYAGTDNSSPNVPNTLILGNPIEFAGQKHVLRVWGGRTLTLNGVISGSGGFTKSDNGTLVLTAVNSYTGDTTISRGTLSLSNASLHDGSGVVLSVNGVLNLSHGIADTVASLTINGVLKGPGTYPADASDVERMRFAGTGSLKVEPLPIPLAQPAALDGYAQWLSTRFGEAATDSATAGETADPNGDGVPNLLAYAMGIHPLLPPAPGATAAQRGTIELLNEDGRFHFDYQRDIRVSDVGLTLEDSSSLGAASDWGPADVVEEILSEEGGIRTIRVTYTPPRESTRRFFRFRASR